MVQPSSLDARFLALIRENIERFLARAASAYAAGTGENRAVLEIAPQGRAGARPYFPANVRIDTLDIDPASKATFIADLCANNSELIPDASYDFVVCAEVLEHTLRPFDAVEEIRRVLKPGGLLFLTAPFNFRIHGPLPDCWRFTEHGLRALLSDFVVTELDALETPERPLMPVHYTVVARKK